MKKQLLLFAILVVSLTCFACTQTPTPTVTPSTEQSVEQSVAPTLAPSEELTPTTAPSVEPSETPTTAPTVAPSVEPTPSVEVSVEPSVVPSVEPSIVPTVTPTVAPTVTPTVQPKPFICAKFRVSTGSFLGNPIDTTYNLADSVPVIVYANAEMPIEQNCSVTVFITDLRTGNVVVRNEEVAYFTPEEWNPVYEEWKNSNGQQSSYLEKVVMLDAAWFSRFEDGELYYSTFRGVFPDGTFSYGKDGSELCIITRTENAVTLDPYPYPGGTVEPSPYGAKIDFEEGEYDLSSPIPVKLFMQRSMEETIFARIKNMETGEIVTEENFLEITKEDSTSKEWDISYVWGYGTIRTKNYLLDADWFMQLQEGVTYQISFGGGVMYWAYEFVRTGNTLSVKMLNTWSEDLYPW